MFSDIFCMQDMSLHNSFRGWVELHFQLLLQLLREASMRRQEAAEIFVRIHGLRGSTIWFREKFG